jgi:hypothetical protein
MRSPRRCRRPWPPAPAASARCMLAGIVAPTPPSRLALLPQRAGRQLDDSARPAARRRCGATYTVAPSGNASPSLLGQRHLDRVGARDRVGAGRQLRARVPDSAWARPPSERTVHRPSRWASPPRLSSGTANTASRGPSCAMRTTGVPAATTWPTSASTPVTTPGGVGHQLRVGGLVSWSGQLGAAPGPVWPERAWSVRARGARVSAPLMKFCSLQRLVSASSPPPPGRAA